MTSPVTTGGVDSKQPGVRLETAGAIPHSLPGYWNLQPLGRGGQGRVFQAIRLADAEKVAIKFIRADRLNDPQARARFLQESRTLAMLDHPGIARVVDQGELDDGQLWFATEYISGLPLNEFANKLDAGAVESEEVGSPRPYPLRDVLIVFVQICDAVYAAHNVGVLHRDLKPSNIIVDDDGRPHVLDFGLAKAPGVTDPALVTLTGQFLGSPAWCSPEQIEARPSTIDVRSDVYSLGVVLYNLLTGEFPFPMDGPLADVFEAIRHGEPIPPTSYASFIDDELETILLKAIAKEKKRRYQTAGELRDEVQRYLRGEPILAKGDGLSYVTSKFLRRHPVVTGVTAAVFVLSIAYGVAMTVLFRRAVSAESMAMTHADDARAKFRMAQQTAEAMLSQIDDVLKKTSGMNEVRKTLLAQLSGQFELLTQEQSSDPALQGDLATAHSKLADVYESVGDVKQAAEHVEASLSIQRQLAANSPDDGDAQAALSIAIVRVGDIARQNGESHRGRSHYEQALKIDESLVARNPQSAHYLDNLSWSYDRLAHLARERGDDLTAAMLHRQRCEIAERLVSASSQSPARLATLLNCYLQFSDLGIRDSDERGAFDLERAMRAAAIADRLMVIDPDNLEHLRLYITSRNFLAIALRLQDRIEDSRVKTVEALNAARRLVEAEPNAVTPRVLLNNVLCAYCDLAEDLRDWSLVTLVEKELIDSTQRLIEIQENALEGQYYLFSAHHRLAHAAWVFGKNDKAGAHMTEALSILKIVTSNPSLPADKFWEFARATLDARPPEFANPKLALEYAERAAAMSEQPGPEKLELLARTREAVRQQIEQAAARPQG